MHLPNPTSQLTAFTIKQSDNITTAGEFAIDSETGVMTVVGELDEENIASYTLTVQAENDLATGVSPVTVSVIDVL